MEDKLLRNQSKALIFALLLLAGIHGFTQKAMSQVDTRQGEGETRGQRDKEDKENNSFFALSPFLPTSYSSFPTPQSNDDPMGQVTSVSQLKDVQPTDWAFQALQSLVERYGCIAGYPDETYRGNRALTRYEFAAGLNACLDKVNELIATATSDLVSRNALVCKHYILVIIRKFLVTT